ncbi:MAG TPA: hypothetical protein VI603_07590 [Saprospiraceae bacterium]|nr:hypothetical protein [Saprospiraceae bacterium]
MTSYRNILSFLALTTLSFCIHGQTTIQPKQIDYSLIGILYNHERAGDLQIHTNGFALAYVVGDIRKYYLTRYRYFGVGLLKHPREYRQAVNFQSGNLILKTSSAFAYGKQHNFIVARAGIGEKRYFSEKAKRKGVAVGISYEGGISLGILKPYYLDLNRLEPSGGSVAVTEKYSEENADLFLDVSRIQGAASFFKGIDEISILPGFHGKIGAHFSIGAFERDVRALELGIMCDIYFKRVPLMIIENNQPFFLNLYATLQIGRRS